ncbi:hypothetical protein LEP3755_02920 [Leptolyngbya sp. NIES-3755]|nr:hypothetical protein LEP3755_02920 [Leptolyngbya sp. NIES-3755]
MGLESFVRVLYTPEDALTLRQGIFRSRKIGRYTLQESDVVEAAEILIALNDANNFHSQADVIERAMAYDWTPKPIDFDEIDLPIQSRLVPRKKGTAISNSFVRKAKRSIVYPLISGIKRFLFKILKVNLHTLNCSGIPKDLLVKLHHIHQAREQIRQVAVAPDEGWVILYGSSGFFYSNVSTDVSDKLWELSNAGELIKQIAFAPNGGWVVLRGRCGFWQSYVPPRMIDKLWSCFNLRQEIQDAAIAANQGWLISNGKNTFSYSHIPDELSDKLWEFQAAGEEIKQVAFAPNGGWVIIREYNDFWYHNIPDDLIEMLWSYHRSGKEIRRVCFAKHSGWIVLGG